MLRCVVTPELVVRENQKEMKATGRFVWAAPGNGHPEGTPGERRRALQRDSPVIEAGPFRKLTDCLKRKFQKEPRACPESLRLTTRHQKKKPSFKKKKKPSVKKKKEKKREAATCCARPHLPEKNLEEKSPKPQNLGAEFSPNVVGEAPGKKKKTLETGR